MPQIKMDKHEVYTYIADNLNWFRNWSKVSNTAELRYRTCDDIGRFINGELRKGYQGEDCPVIKLSGATLTAMVYDGVIDRKYSEKLRCYMYRPILPINEEYTCGKMQ